MWIAPAGVCLMAGLLLAEKVEKWPLILVFKTPLSCLFVYTATALPHVDQGYSYLILAGLMMGLVGDVLLALPSDHAFKAGLAAFLAGHVLYVVAFAARTSPWGWVNFGNLLIIAAGLAVLWWLLPYLGKMLAPVIAYVAVISLMLAAAWAAFRTPAVRDAGEWAILVGALLFYFSDIFVAQNRFVRKQFFNRAVGLPLYYLGQFCIAFSVRLVG
jgi:uncharacterized membrane protein YhhN